MFDFETFESFQLKQNFTNLSLDEISKKLGELVVKIQDEPGSEEVKTELQLSILHINTYDEKLLLPMKELANKVIVSIFQNRSRSTYL